MNARLDRLLRRADLLIAAGRPIPLDLAAALMECGVNVESL